MKPGGTLNMKKGEVLAAPYVWLVSAEPVLYDLDVMQTTKDFKVPVHAHH